MITKIFKMRPLYILFFVIICFAKPLSAQEKEEEVYTFADELPTFKGNIKEFLQENIVYPQEALDNNIQGTVYLYIIINKYGKVADVIIKNNPGGGLGEEAERVLHEMPDWEPGMQNGKPVSVKLTIPVKFVLTQPEKKSNKGKSRRN